VAGPLDWLQQMLGGTMGEMPTTTPQVPDALSQLGGYLENSASNLARVPGGIGRALDWAGTNVAAPALGQMADLYEKDQSQQPLYGGVNESGEVTGRLADLGAALMPYLAGGAPGGAISSGLRTGGATRRVRSPGEPAAPNIGRGSDAPMFDYSRLAEVPNVPQTNLERYVPPRGVPERTQTLADPANVARVNEVVGRGAKMGGVEWYNTEPLRASFREILGEDAGQQAYSRYMDLVASTSPRSKVPENVRNASYYYSRAQQGLPILDPPLPTPYGHMAQKLHVQNARNVLEHGGFPVLQNPKPASFSQNLQGNQMPITADAHNLRLWGLRDTKGKEVDVPANTEYGFVEKLQQDEAARMGLTPAQYQASAWVGGGEQTGLKSSADPLLKVFEDRVRLTAAKRGESPQQTLLDMIRGNLPLLSVGGLAGLGGFGSIPDRTAPAAVY